MKRVTVLVTFACMSCAPMVSGNDGGESLVDAGCAVGSMPTVNGTCVEVGARCGEGFQRDDSGFGCVPVLATCGAGQISVPGSACLDIGWRTCPSGFTRDEWSCVPVLPTAICTGATRAALGNTSCTPVGDCNAAFPPTGATHIVDATHFTTIAAALAAAPAGAVIAIAPGTYRESLTLPRAVKLVGKCAAEVTLIGSPAVFSNGVSGIEIEGVTLRDSLIALRVERGGKVTLRHAIIENSERSGVQAIDVGTEVTLEDVVVRDTRVDSTVAMFGQGIAASFAAQVTLRDVELRNNTEASVFLDREGTKGTLSRVVISDTKPRATTGRLGWGVGAQRGASLTATEVVVLRSTTGGLVVASAPSSATLRDVLVSDTRVGFDNNGEPNAIGVSVSAGATATWNGGASEVVPGFLVHVEGANSQLTMSDVSLQHATELPQVITAGVTVEDGAKATMTRVMVRDAAVNAVRTLLGEIVADQLGVFESPGNGILAQGGHFDGTTVVVRGQNDVAARALQQGTLSISKCVIEDGHGDLAYGLAAQNSVLLVNGCAVREVSTAGIFTTENATAEITNTVITDTRIDSAGDFGQGVVAQSASSVGLIDVTVTNARTAGLQSADGNSVIIADHVLVRGTQANGTGTRGRGANANFGAALHATSTVFLDNRQVGVFAFQSRVDLIDSFINGVKTDPNRSYGNGIEALTDGVIVMRGGGVSRCEGIAAVFAEGAGSMEAVRVFDNEVGLHAQDGSTVEELPTVPASLGSRQVVVSTSTVFEKNRAKLSGSTVTVPAP